MSEIEEKVRSLKRCVSIVIDTCFCRLEFVNSMEHSMTMGILGTGQAVLSVIARLAISCGEETIVHVPCGGVYMCRCARLHVEECACGGVCKSECGGVCVWRSMWRS